MKSTLMRYNFNGGELSPFLDGRVDFPKYTSGGKEMTNFVPTVYGPMTKRPGTRYVDTLPSNAAIYPFEFSEDQAYILAFVEDSSNTDETIINFYTGDGVLLNDGSPFTLECPYYNLEQAKSLKFAQTGDIIYFTHQDAGIVKVSRVSVDDFDIDDFKPIDGPFQDENLDTDSTISVTTGNTEFQVYFETEDDSLFDANSIGKSIQVGYNPATKFNTWFSEAGSYSVGDYLQLDSRIYEVISIDDGGSTSPTGTLTPLHESGSESDGAITLEYVSDGYGHAEITNVSLAPDKVLATIKKPFPPEIVDGDETDAWSWGSFGGSFGWPAAIVFHQQRMILGGSAQQPQTVWGSVTGDIENFLEGTDDDDAFEFTLAANKKNPISWMASNITLSIGTLGSEFALSSSGSAVTPTDVTIEQIGQYGSAANTAPLIANGFTVFNQSGGRKLRELRYDYNSERNFARDLNKTSEHIVDDGIKQIVYQAEPYQVIWTIIGEELYALTYETDEDVYAWSRQSVGNIQSIATVPNSGTDRLWMVVERNGQYYIEYLTKFYRRTDNIEDAIFVDSSLTYEGEEVSIITGLDHLEGETVNVLNNGCVEAPKVVESGQVTLTFPTTKCTIGLPVKSAWQSMRFEGGSQDGVGQGKVKRVSKVIFRLEETGAGFRYGKGNVNKEFEQGEYAELPVRYTTDYMDAPPSLLTGDTERLPQSGGSDSQYMLRIEHGEPVPCTVIAAMITVDTVQ